MINFPNHHGLKNEDKQKAMLYILNRASGTLNRRMFSKQDLRDNKKHLVLVFKKYAHRKKVK